MIKCSLTCLLTCHKINTFISCELWQTVSRNQQRTLRLSSLLLDATLSLMAFGTTANFASCCCWCHISRNEMRPLFFVVCPIISIDNGIAMGSRRQWGTRKGRKKDCAVAIRCSCRRVKRRRGANN